MRGRLHHRYGSTCPSGSDGTQQATLAVSIAEVRQLGPIKEPPVDYPPDFQLHRIAHGKVEAANDQCIAGYAGAQRK